jgi:type IV pilus assembly protein PilW
MFGNGGYPMTSLQNFQPAQSQRGVTLIELLISITIGLVILIAIGSAYVNTTNLTRQRENQSELNDPARNVMQQLQQDISVAGYVDLFDISPANNRPLASALYVSGNTTLENMYLRVPEAAQLNTPLGVFFPGMPPVFGCDGAMAGTPNAISVSPAPAVLACGLNSIARHTLQIAYQSLPSAAANVSRSLSPNNPATGEGRDCLQQNPVAPPGVGGREAIYVINRYFVAPSPADGINELYCAGSGNAIAQPIARGVEEFVVRYQTALPGAAGSGAAGGAQSQYLSATNVSASALGWSNVTAVEICMVSATAVTGGSAAAGTVNLQTTRPTCRRDPSGNFSGNEPRVAGDQRLWKRFTTVKTLRNAIYASPY